MNADNTTNGVFREVEEAIIVTSDTKSEKHSFPCISAFIRVHSRLSILRTVNGYKNQSNQNFDILAGSQSMPVPPDTQRF